MDTQHIALVRAYGGQPLKRVVVEAADDVLFIANQQYLDLIQSGHSKPIGCERRDCFAWNPVEFERLTKIYASEHCTTDDAWSEMPLFQGRGLLDRDAA